MTKTVFRLGELFCGPGGMAIAAHLTQEVTNRHTGESFSIEHSWGVDKSDSAIKTFKANLPEADAYRMDVNHFIKFKLSKAKLVDAIAFGFPCNSFSSLGEQKGVKCETYGKLYRSGISVIENVHPKWFIAENVSGISRRDSGRGFTTILQELANAGKGYNVVSHLYKFEEYGVPQSRHRYVIVGIRQDIAKSNNVVYRIPAPTHGTGLKPLVSAASALSNVSNETALGKNLTSPSDKVKWRLIFTPPGENAWKLDEIILWSDERLSKYLSTIPWFREKILPLGSLSAIREKIEYARLHVTKARMSHIYKRLEADKPAYTLTGSGGGGTHVYHWSEPRALTNKERAALQTFPKDFIFHGTKEEIRKQIGMAVPTEGAKIIFRAILKSFAHVHYDFVEAKREEVFTPHENKF